MKALIVAACLAASLACAGVAQARARDYVCNGAAEAESGGQVEVNFTVDAKGEVKARRASWTPPAQEGTLATLIGGAPHLSVDYEAATEQGVGPASTLSAFSMMMTSDGHIFDDARMVFELPDGRHWSVELLVATGTGPNRQVSMMMGLGEFPVATHAELFADLDGLGRARLSIQRNGVAIKAATYDFSTRAERDQLFTQAWAKAVEAAQQPKKCKKAEG